MSRKPVRLLAVVLAVMMVAAACGGDDDVAGAGSDDGSGSEGTPSGDAATSDGAGDDGGSPSDQGAASDDGSDTGAGGQAPINGGKPVVEVPAGDPPTELEIIDLIEGDGPEVVDGSTVEVHYVGISWSTGEQFDSSWDKGSPFEVTLGQGRVIPGWDQGLIGMHEGGRRELRIPPDLAYRSDGVIDPSTGEVVIGPDETLVFVVDVVQSLSPPDPSTEPEVDFPDGPADELLVEDVTVGEGPPAQVGDRVVVNFVLGVVSTRETVASTWAVGQPFPFDLGGGGEIDTIEGLDLGVVGMQVGGLRRIVVPPSLGFGQETGQVSPDDTLVFMVELVEIR
ncbi:MAG: FKBP-type peptidyl-prolyl cis-trans isomerase [Acidimicrobiales bacterium]